MVQQLARWMPRRPEIMLGSRAGRIAVVALLALAATTTSAGAQQPGVHYWHQGVMPPGAIGSRQLQRGGPLPGFFQPVEIKAPPGALVSLAVAGDFEARREAPVKLGMLIGQVYRIKVANIPLRAGLEVFPTIEVIDRTYAPPDQMRRFPIPIELTTEDLHLALEGKFVTRVIYLEDPRQALPVAEMDGSQSWFEIAPGRDPLAVADALGRPVAILRLGARVPDAVDFDFLYGCPPFQEYPPEVKLLPRPPARQPPVEPPAQRPAEAPAEPPPVPDDSEASPAAALPRLFR
jgi:hypothetical protein